MEDRATLADRKREPEMNLVLEALAFIPDGTATPVAEIPGAWDIAKRVNAIPNDGTQRAVMTPDTTGQELKDTVTALPAQYQLEVLQSLLSVRPRPVAPTCPTPAPAAAITPEQLDAIEDKKFRRWVLKAIVVVMCCMGLMLVGAVVAVAIRSGQLPDTSVLGGWYSFAQEIAKLIFTGTSG